MLGVKAMPVQIRLSNPQTQIENFGLGEFLFAFTGIATPLVPFLLR